LKQGIWNFVSAESGAKFDKLAIAIFQKFSLKKSRCLQMLSFGIGDWLLKLLNELDH
jgi:hypothetical protein